MIEAAGSSPHTRGAPRAPSSRSRRAGIIPAYAGSTTAWANGLGAKRDHPRIRGEHLVASAAHHILPGSSPHTRGAHPGGGRRRGLCRIIPAYAGSTMAAYRLDLMTQDHPRIRGEHITNDAAWSQTKGSSPHTRGARQAILPVSSLARIIPAYAGSTFGTHRVPIDVRDHPRIRGEHRPVQPRT